MKSALAMMLTMFETTPPMSGRTVSPAPRNAASMTMAMERNGNSMKNQARYPDADARSSALLRAARL